MMTYAQIFQQTYKDKYIFDFSLWENYIKPHSPFGGREFYYIKHEIKFKDGSHIFVIMNNRQQANIRNIKCWNLVKTIGGLGYWRVSGYNRYLNTDKKPL